MVMVGDKFRAPPSVRATYAILIGFFVIAFLLVALGDPGCYQIGAACADSGDRYGSWLAFHLLDGGWFDTDPKLPSEPYTHMPPGYALFLAGTFALFGRETFIPAIVLQIAGMAIVALMASRAAEKHLPGTGNLTLAFCLINPSVIAHAALAQTDVPFAIATTAIFALVLEYLHAPSLRLALTTGVTIAASAMIKVPGTYLMMLLPIALPLLVALGGRTGFWKTAVLHGVAGSLVGLVLVAPWGYHEWRSGEGITLQSRAVLTLLLDDGSKYLGSDPVRVGTTALQPTEKGGLVLERMTIAQREADLLARHPNFNELPVVEQRRLERDWIVEWYLTFPGGVGTFVKAVLLSWARLLFGGGEGDWHRLLGFEYDPSQSPVLFYGIKAAALAVTLLSRILGVIGLVTLVRRRQYALVVLIFCWVALFTGTIGLVGGPRYRLPSELPLAILAAIGWIVLGNLLSRFRRTSGPAPLRAAGG